MVDTTAVTESLVALGGHFDGLIDARGAARIEGAVDGEVLVTESLWIGAEARVCARVEARDVVIEGRVEGEILAPEKIELRATARVRATLHTRRFVLADGAHFEGRCHTLPSGPVEEALTAPNPNSESRMP